MVRSHADVVNVAQALAVTSDKAAFRRAWDALGSEGRYLVSAEIERMAKARQDRTPGDLAQRLDSAIVQTPALRIVDREMVALRDSIQVMYARRAMFTELVLSGMDEQRAIDKAAVEIADRGNQRLLLSMPPQEGKSWRVSRHTPLWLLMQFPTLRYGLVSYDQGNANQFSYLVRADIELFDGTAGEIDLGLRLAKDQKAMGRWMLITGGGVYAIGIGGGLTGRPLDALNIDDPVKDVRDAESKLLSQQAWDWWHTVARPRLAPWAPTDVVSTRWDLYDLNGRMQEQQAEDESGGVEHFDKWRVVNISAKADHDPAKGETDILGREPGQFMVSARGRTREQWEATENGTPPRFWNALYQGRPSAQSGDVWLREWWRRYDVALWTQTEDGTYRVLGHDVTISVDCAFRDTASSDYVVMQVWAKKGADTFLVTQVRARMNFVVTLDALKRLVRLFPDARLKIIEGKANGDAVIASLKHDVPGIVVAEPVQSKTARAEAVQPPIRSGNVHLPTTRVATMNPDIAFDVEAFIDECTNFPYGPHDDQVDAASQYLEEAYYRTGALVISMPSGMIPSRQNRPRGATLSPMQRRLTDKALGGK
jgi:predicted phage terminase large subunit-like protein